MMKSRSSFLTICPSLKCRESMKPETRARTSTVSSAWKRPVYSSHSATTLGIGFATVKAGKEHWKHGGASVWVTATYDKDTDTIYQGIGNAGPDYDPEYRPGDNKWAASVLALDPNNGRIKWGFQYTPNDPYDYDEISEHQIIDAKVNGENRKLVVHGAR